MAKSRPALAKDSKLGSRRKLDAFPDRIDVRDLSYQPTLAGLPDILVNCDKVPLILNQGKEGACTGFALSAVINYMLKQRRIKRKGTWGQVLLSAFNRTN